jgi:predicted nucleotidyltransferase
VRSSSSVKFISLNQDSLRARLQQIVARMKAERPEVEEVRLFGSLARGDATGTSDVDILIVLSHAPDADPHRRIITFLPYFDLDRGADLLVLTHAELNRRLSDGDPFLRHVWDESVDL